MPEKSKNHLFFKQFRDDYKEYYLRNNKIFAAFVKNKINLDGYRLGVYVCSISYLPQLLENLEIKTNDFK